MLGTNIPKPALMHLEKIDTVSTADFLTVEEWDWLSYKLPEHIKSRPAYEVTDDDRMYWWDGTDEVVISEETKEWLSSLAEWHQEIKENLMEKKEQSKSTYLDFPVIKKMGAYEPESHT